MAISRIGGTTGNAINGGAITLTLPGGMAVDDLIIVAYGAGDDDFTQPTLAMTTADYTELTTSTLSADGGTGGDGNLAVFYKYHNGTDTEAVCAASGAGSDSSTAACLQVFRGVATVAQGGPLEITIQTATGTSGGDPNPPSVSGFTEATSAVVIACALGNAAALTLTAPTNYTTNALNAVGNDTFDASVGLAYRLTGAADPEDPGVFTDSGAGVAWCAATMVLKAFTSTTFPESPADTVTLTEAQTQTVSKPRAETVVLTEGFSAVRTSIKAFNDTISFVEGFTKQVNKALAETVSLAESQLVAVNKRLADTVSLTEDFLAQRVTVQAVDDTVSLVEGFRKQVNEALAESVSLAEAQVVTVAKRASDTVGLTESLTAVRTTIRDFSETIGMTEALRKVLTKSRAETVGLTENVTAVSSAVSGYTPIQMSLSIAIRIG
jgi:hypothetical protein